MNGVQYWVVGLVGLAALCVGAAVAYVYLKSTMPKQTWLQLVVIVQTAQRLWGKVFTPEAAKFFAKKFYEGLLIEQRFGYTLDEWTAMFMWLVPVRAPEGTRGVGAVVPELTYGFDELELKASAETIMLNAMSEIEANPV